MPGVLYHSNHQVATSSYKYIPNINKYVSGSSYVAIVSISTRNYKGHGSILFIHLYKSIYNHLIQIKSITHCHSPTNITNIQLQNTKIHEQIGLCSCFHLNLGFQPNKTKMCKIFWMKKRGSKENTLKGRLDSKSMEKFFRSVDF